VNKGGLVNEVGGLTKLNRAAVHSVDDAAMEVISSTMGSRQRVILMGVAAFGVVKRRARTINHPRTGKPMRIEARVVPEFHPGAALRHGIAAKRGRGRPRRR